MKIILLLSVILSIIPSIISQNILEAIQLKNKVINNYTEGELSSTDTIIDLRNGYYEEFNLIGNEQKNILRQAAIFNNKVNSITLGISTSEWDFQCFNHNSSFYVITDKNKIRKIENKNILPQLEISDFIKNGEIIPTLEKYLPLLRDNYLSKNAAMKDLLSELYDIKYIIPQNGTTVLATLAFCDYIPTNEIQIKKNDLSIIETDFSIIELVYNTNSQSFKIK